MNKGNASTALAQINKAKEAAKSGIRLPINEVGIKKADFLALVDKGYFNKK